MLKRARPYLHLFIHPKTVIEQLRAAQSRIQFWRTQYGMHSAKGQSEFKPAAAIHGDECSERGGQKAGCGGTEASAVKMSLKLSPYGLTIWFNKQMRQFPAKRRAFVEILKLNRKGPLQTKREYRYGWTKK